MKSAQFRNVLEKIDKDFYHRIELDLKPFLSESSIESVLKTNIETIGGKIFYFIFSKVSDNFDQDCLSIFKEIIDSELKKFNKSYKEFLKNNKIKRKASQNFDDKKRFIDQFIIQQYDVAEKAGISPSRLSKVLKNTLSDFYAYEVVSLAITNNLSPKSAFEQLYSTPLTEEEIPASFLPKKRDNTI